MKKVELLAPAGNYRAFDGALGAGADAVYLGGDQFSARAYADNFTKEEICRALRYAHLNGVKLYLTLNTLIKEKEFSGLYDYAAPFYEAGLDGVIIQDLGVWQFMRENFPDLELHASTQMTVTGTEGALLLKEMGASRIVPARELSLAELKEIKEKTGLELECFIHGAMCYSYSGQCLFSSILGGRSGNRGRCAQPCRLPYQVTHADEEKTFTSGECYPLSLKDMCTLEFLPALLESGIDSLKIEGRMKRPEYAAGVTAIYRKYIDRYYADGAAHYQVEKEDLDRLGKLYIRSGIQTGYYERHNGREMITLHKPGYAKTDETLLAEIVARYMGEEKRYPAAMKGIFRAGEAAVLQITGNGITHTARGAIVQEATGRPMEEEAIAKQLRKMGNSHLTISDNGTDRISIEAGESVFIPVGQLNELRRNAVEAFENKLIEAQGLSAGRKLPERQKKRETDVFQPQKDRDDVFLPIHVMVRTLEQLEAVCHYPCERVYLDSDLYLREMNQICQYLEKFEKNAIYLALPYIIRKQDETYLKNLVSVLELQGSDPNRTKVRIKGFLARNLETLFWVRYLSKLHGKEYETVSDAGIYCFNSEAAQVLHAYCAESYLPYELNAGECRQLLKNKGGHELSMIVYGTIPMMVTANCLRKTTGCCVRDEGMHVSFLQDRYQTRFPVLCNCRHCYNVIYNSLPYSLHGWQKEWRRYGLAAARLDFSLESGRQTQEILDYYYGQKNVFPVENYTAGHYKRGVS